MDLSPATAHLLVSVTFVGTPKLAIENDIANERLHRLVHPALLKEHASLLPKPFHPLLVTALDLGLALEWRHRRRGRRTHWRVPRGRRRTGVLGRGTPRAALQRKAVRVISAMAGPSYWHRAGVYLGFT